MIIQERERSAERNSGRNPPGSQHRAADHGQRDNCTHHAIDARLQRADGLISGAWHTHTVSDFTHESSRRFYMARRELPNWSAGISARIERKARTLSALRALCRQGCLRSITLTALVAAAANHPNALSRFQKSFL